MGTIPGTRFDGGSTWDCCTVQGSVDGWQLLACFEKV